MNLSEDHNTKNGRSPRVGAGETQADQIFYMLFYVCLGFLATAIGVFGRSAFQIPFFLICFFICLRVFMHSDCRSRMAKVVHSRELLLMVALAVTLLIYAIISILGDSAQFRLLRKPATLFVGATLLAFIWSHKDILDDQKVFRGLFYGVIGGLVGVVLISIWQWNVMATSGGADLRGAIPIRIYALNDELKILSVLIFFTAAGLATKFNRIFFGACMAAAVFALSFYTLGTYGLENGKFTIVHADSEAVQFGLPIALLTLLFAALVPRLMTQAVFLGVAGILITAPWLFQFWYNFAVGLDLLRAKKFLVRAEIWDAVSREALMKPFFGHGLDAARTPNLLRFEQKYYKAGEVLHPHNMFVQIWLDMGLVGVAFAVAICFFAWRGVCKVRLELRPPLLAGIVMYVLFALVTHSVWTTWSMLLLLVMFVLGSLLATKNENHHAS